MRLAVGARERNINGNNKVGSVYTYRVSGDVLTHDEEIENPLAYETNYFGNSEFGSSVTVYRPDGMMIVGSIRDGGFAGSVQTLRWPFPYPPPPSPPPPPNPPPPSPPPPRWVHIMISSPNSSPCHKCGMLVYSIPWSLQPHFACAAKSFALIV